MSRISRESLRKRIAARVARARQVWAALAADPLDSDAALWSRRHGVSHEVEASELCVGAVARGRLLRVWLGGYVAGLRAASGMASRSRATRLVERSRARRGEP